MTNTHSDRREFRLYFPYNISVIEWKMIEILSFEITQNHKKTHAQKKYFFLQVFFKCEPNEMLLKYNEYQW